MAWATGWERSAAAGTATERSVPTAGDRLAPAEWVRCQRVCATVRLEAVVPFDPAAEMLAPITDWVYVVDNLTEADRVEAAAYHTEMRRWVETLRAKQAEPGATPDPAGM